MGIKRTGFNSQPPEGGWLLTLKDKIMKYIASVFAAVLAACSAPVVQAENHCGVGAQIDLLTDDYLPPGYIGVERRDVSLDGETAEWVRYQPAAMPQTVLGGAHFSTLTTAAGCLKGFAWIAPQLVGGVLPDKEHAQAVADDFLRRHAPDLAAHREVHWIDEHHEPLSISGKRMRITGMKVKMRNPADGRWFWVIVGHHGRAMVFERDIVWISFPGHRQTEKWLHDEWLAARL